jgi:hypothetical protein
VGLLAVFVPQMPYELLTCYEEFYELQRLVLDALGFHCFPFMWMHSFAHIQLYSRVVHSETAVACLSESQERIP